MNSLPAGNAVDIAAAPRRFHCVIPYIALAAIVLATALVRPGDAPFLNDEPLLLHMAYALNHLDSRPLGIHLPFTLCGVNMAKTPRGLYYGPAAIWLYQSLLAITLDPIALVMLHALLLAAATALALAWLAHTMRVTAWLAVVVMLSPWLWIYHRILWDNNLCIPLSAMALAAYASFLATQRARSLRVAVACAALLPLVHLMSLALVVPLALHLLFFRFRAVLRYKWSLLAIVAAINGLAWQYWQYLLVFYEPIQAVNFSPWRGWVFPFFGAQDLSAAALENLLGDDWFYRMPAPVIIAGAQLFSCLAYVAVWAGMLLAARRTWQLIRRTDISTTNHIAAIALATLICQCVLDGTQRVYGLPHYFNATWIAYVVFAWLAVAAVYEHLWNRSLLVRMIVPAQAAALTIVLAAMIFKIARDGGTRTLGYGTVLSEQIAATRQINQFSPDSRKMFLFQQWALFPGALATLQELMPPPSSPDTLPRQQLIIRDRDAYPGDARIVVEIRPL